MNPIRFGCQEPWEIRYSQLERQGIDPWQQTYDYGKTQETRFQETRDAITLASQSAQTPFEKAIATALKNMHNLQLYQNWRSDRPTAVTFVDYRA